MNKNYIAVIQAGGKGTRMLERTGNLIPKPMLQLNGKPMLQWQIENVSRYGIQFFVIIIGHLGYKIKEYFGDGDFLGVHIEYIEEVSPLGSAGALYFLKEFYKGFSYLFIYGDVMFRIDLNRLFLFHEEKKAQVTMLVHPNSHPYDSDLLVLSRDYEVVAMDSKNNVRSGGYNNCANAGVYVFNERFVQGIEVLHKLDLEHDLLEPLMNTQSVYGYVTSEYIKDAGTPERFDMVSKDQLDNIWEIRCLENKQKCIFLDRDGTINRYKGLISREDQFELEDGVGEAIRLINHSSYLAIVVTNQPVVARGLCDIDDVERIHKKMEALLGEKGAFLDDIVFCPHHPDGGYPEENPVYKVTCDCRKPSTGMINRMAKKYNIDLVESYMIGDSTIDIKTGKNAGLKTVLLGTGNAGKDGKYEVQADFFSNNLLNAVKLIISQR